MDHNCFEFCWTLVDQIYQVLMFNFQFTGNFRLVVSGSEHVVSNSKFTQGLGINACLTEFTQVLCLTEFPFCLTESFCLHTVTIV